MTNKDKPVVEWKKSEGHTAGKLIIVNMEFMDVVMFNPVIVSKRDMYETEEGCLSLDGVRKTTRYQEIDHLSGKII